MLRIEIVLPDEQVAPSSLAQHMRTLGFYNAAPPAPGVYEQMQQKVAEARAEDAKRLAEPETPAQQTQAPLAAEVQPEPASEAPKAKRGRPAKAKPEPQPEPEIRANPEDRIDPETAEDEIQDIQDEVAEVEASRDPVNPLTVDDVRQALGTYVKKFGTPAALEDGAKLLASALGNPPEGEPIWKMSILPDDQEALRKAVASVTGALESNPYGREAV